jgi:uncharacterized protein (DUF1800 family)
MAGKALRSIVVAGLVLFSGLAVRAVDEVGGLQFVDGSTATWNPVASVDFYNVYRGSLSLLGEGLPGRCHRYAIPSTIAALTEAPEERQGFFYLVTAESGGAGEGTAGTDSAGAARPLLGRCTPVLRHHVLNRLGYGSDSWTRERIAALGFQGYIDEQLDPGSIRDKDNQELQSRLGPLKPPEDIIEQIAQRVVRAVYSWRQLEQQYTAFWVNHFNTDWSKIQSLYNGVFPPCTLPVPQCDPNYPARSYFESSKAQNDEMTRFRELGFNGSFREMVEASALGTAMIIYLDTYTNVDDGINPPNENYARELLELYAMGVDGGYSQTDVEELARVFTGWTICKKVETDLADPLAPCLAEYWADDPPGAIVATYRAGLHDCGQKVLFADTPQELTIPDTCANPIGGVLDVDLALDAIAAHPATARFISGKILQRFVTEEPTEEMVDVLVAVWNNPGNPNGVGDLREVLRAALQLEEFLDPQRLRDKIKTPLEHYASAIRSVGGRTDGQGQIIDYLVLANQTPHFNPVPTGYPEVGSAWIDTNGVLTRQNFGILLVALDTPEFGSNPVGFLEANGISTASEPDNASPPRRSRTMPKQLSTS